MAIEYQIDLTKEGRSYPHYWEMCVGSCHAATVLREDVREHIRNAHRDCGFQYLRFHGLLDDDMSVVIQPYPFAPREISFYNIDCVFDFLLDTGMKPFVEIGFMPEALASGTATLFHYKANRTLPKDFDEWADFIRQFIRHLLERYGKEEVSQWFFEVWNEPNLSYFFEGKQEDYYKLYQVTAEAIKDVDKDLYVGGPATSNNSWITSFLDFCEKNQVPVDFVTTHHYPSDDMLTSFGQNDGSEFEFKMPTPEELDKMSEEERKKLFASFGGGRENKNDRDVLYQMTKKAKEQAGNYPLYYTEWNGSTEFDTCYQSAFIAHTLAHNENLVEGYSFWTVTDIFEEMGMIGRPFKNAFGMQTNHGIPKPSYRMFELLHRAGDKRLDVTGEPHRTAEVFALKGENKVSVFVYNHDIVRRNISAEEIKLTFQGPVRAVRRTIIDEHHCNPKAAWEAMGSPDYLSKEQEETIRQASKLQYEELVVAGEGKENWNITFTAEPESVTVFEVEL
ncbi:MAG: beta-xylosidase [Lachnospiraceae bacterium]|jgi:xylan 1,4-beta-xylosidase|nr:beta-xylosidase [Lachnospiraceae bacterium]